MREVEIVLVLVLEQGASPAETCRRIAISEQTYHRWRKEYGRYGYRRMTALQPSPRIAAWAIDHRPQKRRH
nr:helix-turn-helix domain-containing protein [Sphingobium sp. JAI105]